MCTAGFLCAQATESASASAAAEANTRRTPTETVPSGTDLLSITDENSLPISTPSGGSNVLDTGRRVGAAGVFVRMVVVLAFVIAIIWLLLRFMRRGMGGEPAGDDPFLRSVASVSLGQGRSVQVVTCLDSAAYLVGVTEGSISLLGTITDTELIQAMNLNADRTQNINRPRSFSDILELFTKRGGFTARPQKTQLNQNRSAFDESSERLVDMLKKRHERFSEES